MKVLLLIMICLNIAFASITDDAYKAYKARNYKKAIALYKRGAVSGSHLQRLKSNYNLGVFYYRGIGVKKSKAMAIKYFRKASLMGIGIVDSLDRQYYKTSTIKILRDTHAYLVKLDSGKQKRYSQKALKKLNSKLKERLGNSKNSASSSNDPFLSKCPAAKIVPKIYRENAKYIDCKYYKRYPHIIKRQLKYYYKLKEVQKAYNDEAVNKIRHSMVRNAKPILLHALRQRLNCEKRAITYGNLNRCEINYISVYDELTSSHMIQRYADSSYLFASPNERANRRDKLKMRVSKQDKLNAIHRTKQLIKKKSFYMDY